MSDQDNEGTDFKSLLGSQVDKAERPKTFPEGPYSAVITSHEFGKSSVKGTDFVRYFLKLTGPMDGVNMDDFEEAGGQVALVGRKPLTLDFYITTDAMIRLREFLDDTLELESNGRAFDEVIPEATNRELVVEVILTPIKGREGEYYMNAGRTYAAAA